MKKKKANRGKIILVGKRKGAIAAARRCGWEPVMIDVKARMEQSHLAFGGAAVWAVDYARTLFPDDEMKPVAVAAVTTGSVVAAAAIRSHFGLPGIGPDVAMRCHDKLVMKKAITEAGIPCAPWVETDEQTTADELIDLLGLPLVVKMPISSGGRGVWICHSLEEVTLHLRPGYLAEGFVAGTEMSVETFRASDVTIFQNFTHYLKPQWASIVPAALDTSDAKLVNDLAEKVHQALGISSGMSHMEVFLGENGPVFGEIAARPPGGYLMKLMSRAYEFDPWELLLRLSAGEIPAIKQEAKRYAGVWLIHPGEGKVSGIEGIDEVLAMTHVVEASCKLLHGDVITDRAGSGDSKGYILAEADTLKECADTLRHAVDTINISQIPLEK
jgi:formate-dependent phosphoribosylglycinamide formyltransferase (GAR transformylase)